MHYKFKNVNSAFSVLIQDIHLGDIPTRRTTSRVGDVLQVEEPVTITYLRPRERILFNQARDANVFFHLYESIWMLAGRNDVAPLSYFNSKIADIASDDGETFNGAYGYRWRHVMDNRDDPPVEQYKGNGFWKDVDQLAIIIKQLKQKPNSRRCVLQMWNVENDLLKIDTTKDTCCNVCAFFSIRYETAPEIDEGLIYNPIPFLDMTVINRSNDLIWGALGANVVHFSILQEYVAACIGVEVGVYNQISNNLHCYVDRWEPEKWLADKTPVCYDDDIWQSRPHGLSVPLVKDPAVFDQECIKFIEMGQSAWTTNWKEPFLQTVVSPMCWAFRLHKERMYAAALDTIELVAAEDWRIAGRLWLEKRESAWRQKNA